MRSNILTLTLLAGMTLGGAAFAGTTAPKVAAPKAAAMMTTKAATMTKVAATKTTGTITKIDAKALFVVLSDGHRYHVPAGFALTGFKVGEKVAVTFETKGKHHNVTAMTAA